MNDSVVEYYEHNTRFFLRVGEGGEQGHIHRGVWADEVGSLEQALHYVYSRIHQRIDNFENPPISIVDLGCGVGAGLRYFSESGVATTGVTISPRQAMIARKLNAQLGHHMAQVVCADFCSADLGQVDLMYAVESLVHASDCDMLAKNISRSLALGGELIVCDDFLARPYDVLSPRDQLAIDCVREGWQVPSLNTQEHFQKVFASHGLECVHSEDWTAYLQLNRLRDKFLSMVMKVGEDLPFKNSLWGSWKAGNALRNSLLDGLTQYRFGIWKKVR